MKPSKRERDRQAAKAAKVAGGKPAVSKYARKGGPYGYDYEPAKPRDRERR